MTIEINLDDVDPWEASGVILGPGTHIIEVVDQEEDESGDHPEVKLQMVSLAGDEQGGECRDWIHVTQAALGRVAQVLVAFGVELPGGTFKFPNLKGKKAKIVVRREPKKDEPDKTVIKVKGYLALDDTDKVAASFNATEVRGSGDPGPEARDSGDPGPDIPF